MKKLVTFVMALIIAFSALAYPTDSASAASASIKSVYFYLYRWDGPMYADIKAYCPYATFVDVDGYDFAYRSGTLNGTWRVWFGKDPRVTRTIVVSCHSSGLHGVYWKFSAWYSGNTLRVTRTATGSF